MSKWGDPPVWVTMLVIVLFGYAYLQNPNDEAMKGALIAAFAAAYGYWIGANRQSQQATENTGEAFKAMQAQATGLPPNGKPVTESHHEQTLG